MRRGPIITFAGSFLVFLTTLCALALSPAQQAALQSRPYFGVNLSGAEYAPWNGQTFPTTKDFAYLAAHRVPYVRLAFALESLFPTLGGAINSTYLGKIQTAIQQANAYGIGTILDMHNFGAYCQSAYWTSSGCGYAGNEGSTGTGVNFLGDGTFTSADYVSAWTAIAQPYPTGVGGMPGLIGYDLMNEPVNNLIQYGKNYLVAPNGFSYKLGSQNWNAINSAVLTQLSPGSNPLGSNYGPAWTMTSGTGYGGVQQSITLPVASVPYTMSLYAKVASGTQSITIGTSSPNGQFTATTSWQRFTYSWTPSGTGITADINVNSGSTGITVYIADAQLESGSSATSYVGSVIQPFYQAAATGIRTVDSKTPIYIEGMQASCAYSWMQLNTDLPTMTGGPFVYEAHQYFDVNAPACGGGTYATNYSGFTGLGSYSGAQEIQPFIFFLQYSNSKGLIGETGIPNTPTTDSDAQWFAVLNGTLAAARSAGVAATIWNYGNNGCCTGGLNVAPVSGTDSPIFRLINAWH